MTSLGDRIFKLADSAERDVKQGRLERCKSTLQQLKYWADRLKLIEAKKPKPLDPKKDFTEPVKKAPKQESLPGMEDTEISDLEDAARNYASVRDERMALTKKEVDLAGVLLQALKRHNKEHYHRDGIDIKLVVEKEKVRVRIKDEEE
jgi:hypothetical protein